MVASAGGLSVQLADVATARAAADFCRRTTARAFESCQAGTRSHKLLAGGICTNFAGVGNVLTVDLVTGERSELVSITTGD